MSMTDIDIYSLVLASSVVWTADSAYANGVLWVNSGGNEAQAHYFGTFRDTNGNGRHEFSGGDETIGITVSSGQSIHVCFTWDA